MKRHAILTVFASALLLLWIVGCGQKNSPAANAAAKPAADTNTAAAPPLPTDVAPVAGIAKADPPATASAPTAPTAAAPAPTAADAGNAANAGNAGNADNGKVAATGELLSPVRSELAMRLPGRVGRILVDEGARVRRGQPLLTLETEYLKLDLERAEADLARARAATQDAERDLGRKKELIAKSSVSQAAYDRSDSAWQSAKAAEQSAVAARDLARQKVADAVLVSPIDGIVAERRTDVGQRLGDNSVAFVVAQTSPLKLRFKLPERYLSEVRKGQTVSATVAPYPRETFTGKVTLVGGVVDPATRSFNVETEFANRDGRLTPGLFARVELSVPSGAPGANSAAEVSEGGAMKGGSR
jgi:RND family efflux transporter MFP subunit